MRTPGQAVMFLIPIIAMLPIFLQFWDIPVIRVSNVVISIVFPSIMLGFFSIFFLGVEARGMAFTLTLPLKTGQILRAKAQLITCMSITVPLFVVAVSFFRPLTHPVSYAIAFSQIAVVYVSAILSLVIFIRFVGGGRLVGFDVGRHVTQMLIVGIASTIVACIPIALLGGVWITVATITGSLDLAHWSGLAGLWAGIFLNYLLGKLFTKYLLVD